MEVGTEISQKIRSAIKAKLIELGAYVDDELPDYIMVMVANKKSKEQMVSDLKLFLGAHTDTFAEWLHGLLGKLQTISVDSSNKSTKEKRKSDSKKEKKKSKSGKSGESSSAKSRTDSRKAESIEHKTVSVVSAEDADKSRHKSKTNTEVPGGRPAEVEDVRQMLVTVAPTDELAAELETTEARIEQSQVKTSQKALTSSTKPRESTLVTAQRKRSASTSSESDRRVQSNIPKKPKCLSSVVATVRRDEEEEYDPLCPAVGNVASVVKVTNRKSRIQPALQANRALLMKAMGEAERSIAIKRKGGSISKDGTATTAERDDSPTPAEVYSPKRRKSTGKEASPPPYIPSRKESSSGFRSSSSITSTTTRREDQKSSQREHNKTADARQLLSSRDRRDLISRSRRMELFRKIGIDRKEDGPVVGGVRQHEARRTERDKQRERERPSVSGSGSSSSSTREVSGSRKNSNGGVRDLTIMARLGPANRDSQEAVRPSTTSVRDDKKSISSSSKGLDLRDKMTRASSYNSKDDNFQIIINPTASPALKGSVASRLGKAVNRRIPSSSSANVGNDNYEDDEEERRNNGEGDRDRRREGLKLQKTIVNTDRPVPGRKAVSSLAKNLVNKQCRVAVMSVSSSSSGSSKDLGHRQRSASPDSRVVEAGDDDDNEEEEDDNIGNVERVKFRSPYSVSPKSPRSDEKKVLVVVEEGGDGTETTARARETEKCPGKDDIDDIKDAEDLEVMIEGDDEVVNEPELLRDPVTDELNLDLEGEDIDDADDIETMIGVKSLEDKQKAGTRFIVTLEGIDERQFEAGTGERSQPILHQQQQSPFVKPAGQNIPLNKLASSIIPYNNNSNNIPPQHPHLLLSPVLPMQQQQGSIPPTAVSAWNLTPPLPPQPYPVVLLPSEPISKPLPPKIQPFSINLKDSDDELDDKEPRLHAAAVSSSSAPQSYARQTSKENLTALQKAKLAERCKFWPACSAGTECEFHHPTSYCKTFPHCKFGDKCLFIHPNCRFDSKCTRPDCPFTHTSRRPGVGSTIASAATIPFSTTPAALPPTLAPSPAISTVVCHFFPHCQNISCPFLHPARPCRFGAACQNPHCAFYHPPVVPSKDQLKWKSQAQLKRETSNTTTTSSTTTSSSSSTTLKLPAAAAPNPAAKFTQPVAKVSPMSAGGNSAS